MKYVITGGCGFLGSNIADNLLSSGQSVVVFDNLSRFGSAENLHWLRGRGNLTFMHGDIRKADDVEQLISTYRPDVVFHLGGQVAMTTSVARPLLDFEINALGSVQLLESLKRHCPGSIVVYSSTNKVYGDLETIRYEETATRYRAPDYPNGFAESVPLDFRSPYGCSKGAADQYMLDCHRMFGIRTVVFRHSSIYGGRQFSTYDQGWIGWFCAQGLRLKNKPGDAPFTVSGNGKQVRDLLFASDAVALYVSVPSHIEKTAGRAFNIGGGMANSLSVNELLSHLGRQLDVDMRHTTLPARASDQKVFVADLAAITKATGWTPKVTWEQGIDKMLDWIRGQAL